MRGLQISSQTYFRWWKQFWSYLSEVSYVSQILESHFWQESFPPTGAGGNAAKVRVQTQRCSLESSVFSRWKLDGRHWPDHAIRVDAPQQSRHLLAPQARFAASSLPGLHHLDVVVHLVWGLGAPMWHFSHRDMAPTGTRLPVPKFLWHLYFWAY